MPRQNKKRGRRADTKKRKLDAAEDEPSKRLKQDADWQATDGAERDGPIGQAADYIPLEVDAEPTAYGRGDNPFYGLLDESEQEYFRKANDLLERDDFTGPDDRAAFVASVFAQAEGSELRLVNSQSCSRLLERLIRVASKEQIKMLFSKFGKHYVPLFQHRFASHCCEALFVEAVPVLMLELESASILPQKGTTTTTATTMEDLFLAVAHEVEDHVGWMMTETFASHPLRVLLLVLAGQPVDQTTTKSGLRSKRKEHVVQESRPNPSLLEERNVPASFTAALESLIAKSIAGIDTLQLRALSTHKTGNPMIQLLIRLESTHFGKHRAKEADSVLHLLLPDDPIVPDTSSTSFVHGLAYDPIGSRLLETMLQAAPAKTFKSIYAAVIKENLVTMARNDVACYPASKALERLSKEDVQQAIAQVAPAIPSLVDKHRLLVIRTLIERSTARSASEESLILLADALRTAYSHRRPSSPPPANDTRRRHTSSPDPSTSSELDMALLLHLTPSPTTTASTEKEAPSQKTHSSLLAQSMLLSPGPLSSLALTSLNALPAPLLLAAATDPSASHALSTALTSPHASALVRRKTISALYGHVASLAVDPSGARVLEAVWRGGTRGLQFVRERVAEELAESGASLRSSAVGRRVWSVWGVDMFRKRRRAWEERSKREEQGDGTGGGFVGFPEDGGGGDVVEEEKGSVKRHMSALERARERYAKGKRDKARRKGKERVDG